jgi:xanthine dehydrogenase large subunit
MRNLPNPPIGDANTLINGIEGVDQKHESAHKHVSGEAMYIDDQLLPVDGLHAYVGLSQQSHGLITTLDLSKVRLAEGVIDVLTLDDISGHKDIGPVFPGDPIMVNYLAKK